MSSTDQLMMMRYHNTQTPGQAKLSLTADDTQKQHQHPQLLYSNYSRKAGQGNLIRLQSLDKGDDSSDDNNCDREWVGSQQAEMIVG